MVGLHGLYYMFPSSPENHGYQAPLSHFCERLGTRPHSHEAIGSSITDSHAPPILLSAYPRRARIRDRSISILREPDR